MDKVRSVVISGLVVLGMGVEANASTSVSAAYGQCKAEVLEKFGLNVGDLHDKLITSGGMIGDEMGLGSYSTLCCV